MTAKSTPSRPNSGQRGGYGHPADLAHSHSEPGGGTNLVAGLPFRRSDMTTTPESGATVPVLSPEYEACIQVYEA